MSNIFLKNELNGIFDTATESNVSLPQWISIIDKANNTNTKSEKSASVTSSALVGQLGGAYSVTSANSTRDVNKLVSMLTSESSSSNFKGLSETSTASLEEQLREILNQDGGAKKHRKSKKSQKGGADTYNVESVKQFFTSLKNSGVNVDVKLNDKTLSEFFAEPVGVPGLQAIDATTTELISATSENNMTNINNLNVSATSVSVNEAQVGGAKKSKKSSKKASKKSSKKASKKSSKKGSKKSLDGGVNAGFQAFLDLKKYIAEKLGVSNGPIAAKVAGAVQKDMKEKHPDKDAVTIAAEGRKHFDKNMDHYKQMLPK